MCRTRRHHGPDGTDRPREDRLDRQLGFPVVDRVDRQRRRCRLFPDSQQRCDRHGRNEPATFTGLACGTTYTFGVAAYDAAGNTSTGTTLSAATSACAPSGDTQAPTTPSGLAVNSATQTSLSLSWSASTDNVGVTGYGLFGAGSGTVATPSTSIAGLACGTSYTRPGRCIRRGGQPLRQGLGHRFHAGLLRRRGRRNSQRLRRTLGQRFDVRPRRLVETVRELQQGIPDRRLGRRGRGCRRRVLGSVDLPVQQDVGRDDPSGVRRHRYAQRRPQHLGQPSPCAGHRVERQRRVAQRIGRLQLRVQPRAARRRRAELPREICVHPRVERLGDRRRLRQLRRLRCREPRGRVPSLGRLRCRPADQRRPGRA